MFIYFWICWTQINLPHDTRAVKTISWNKSIKEKRIAATPLLIMTIAVTLKRNGQTFLRKQQQTWVSHSLIIVRLLNHSHTRAKFRFVENPHFGNSLEPKQKNSLFSIASNTQLTHTRRLDDVLYCIVCYVCPFCLHILFYFFFESRNQLTRAK